MDPHQDDSFKMHFRNYHSKSIAFNHQSMALGLSVRDIGYLEAGEKYILNPRVLDFYSIIYVSKGEGRFNCLGKSYPLSKGSVLFLFPGVTHSYSTPITNLFSHWWIDFYGYNAKILLNSMGISPENPMMNLADPHELEGAFNFLLKPKEQREITPIAATSNLYRILAVLSNAKEHELTIAAMDHTDPFHLAKNFIDANYQENISIHRAAEIAGISSTSLIKRFKSRLGCSPSQYMAILRLDLARKLLLETELSITDIAFACGFDDPQYFSRFIKKRTGFSPSTIKSTRLSSR